MNELIVYLLFLLIGIITGSASSLLGIGGGLIFVPALTFLLPAIGVPPEYLIHIVIATSLFAGSISSASAFYQHYKIHNVEIKKSLLMASGSFISAIIVPRFVISLNSQALKIILATFLILVALKILFEKDDEVKRVKSIQPEYLFLFGLVIGAIPAVSGLGAGIIIVPLLTYFYSLNIKRAIGTSTLVVSITMFSSTLSYGMLHPSSFNSAMQLGYINLIAGLTLGLGSIIGSNFGAMVIKSISAYKLKKIFATFIIAVIIKMMV